MRSIREEENRIVALIRARQGQAQQATGIVVGLFLVVIGLHFAFQSHAATPSMSLEPENGTITAPASKVTDTTASGGQAIKFGSQPTGNCVVTDKLVNPCRPWLGAWANKYPQPGSGLKNQILYHERRIGRQADVVKDFLQYGDTLSSDDKYFISRPNTILQANWKAFNTKWADAGGSNATVNAKIDAMADSIKSVAPQKIMLAIAHEPENKVSGGVPGCPASAFDPNGLGTPADYRAMWQNVENRFNARGVKNVVWDMIYVGNPKFFCLDKDMYPGDNLVQWVTWDPYNFGSNTMTWNNKINVFYNWLTNNTDATHSFTSKTWGITEWGMGRGVTQAATYAYYDEAKAALEHNTYPNLKLYTIFDSVGPNSSGTFDDLRTLYDINGNLDQTEQNHYNAFANSSAFKNP